MYNNIKKLNISNTEKARKLDSLLQQGILKKDSASVEAVSYKYTNWLNNRGMAAKAIATIPLSIQYHAENSNIINLFAKWRKLGRLHYSINNYEESIDANKKAIAVSPEDARIYLAYQQIGLSYYYLSDYESSIVNFEIASTILKERGDYTNLIHTYIKASNSYRKKNTINTQKKNLKNLLFADSISTYLSIDTKTKISIQRVLGIHYSEYDIRDTLKGQLHINKALELAKKENDSVTIASTYTDLAILYDISNPKKSITYLKEGLKYVPNNKPLKSFIYANLGLNNVHLENFDEGIDQLYTSLQLLTGSRFDLLSFDKKKESIQENLNQDNLWSILSRIAQSYNLKSDKTQNTKLLDSALTYYKLVDYTFDLHQSRNKLTSSKFIWRKEAAEVYTRSLRASLHANDIETGFNFMEKNKSLILSEEIHRLKNAQKSDLPEDLILAERKLQNKIKSLQRDENKNITQLKESLDSLEKVQKEIEEYPDNTISYTSTKYSISDIQEQLDASNAIIEYHIGDDDGFGVYPNTDTGYGILITKEETVFFPIEKLQDFSLKVEQLLLKNTIPFKTEDDIKAYQQLSYEIYATLFPPSVRTLIKSKELTIIPDDYLSKIPFESLIVSPNTSENEYLIYHHKIGYKYNYAFHEINRNNIPTANTSFAAFAPVDFTNLDLPKLTGSIKETESLDAYFSGNTFSEKEASQASFFQELGTSNLIHLATHADANDSISPWIAFSDGKLFLDDISLHQNNASLVMLSACNSNAGEMVIGEGTMSLARGFFYGGAQSTISSLWNVDDKSTQYIVDAFYKNLHDGASKSSALHQAKLDYLKNHTGSEVAPYYWASLVLIGDTNPLPQKDWFWYYIVAGGLLLLLLFMLSRKRKKTS